MTGLALYVHWPFCKAKCPYCDCNSHVRASIDEARWRAALLKDLEHYAGLTRGRAIASIFFGGGTPSLMAAETVATVLERAAALWPLEPDVEITLEGNPTSVEAARFREFRSAGVNRVSLGVQALEDGALKFLGRGHDVREALAALDVARQTFGRFSFDLIYARPGQTVASWEPELDRAIALAGEHLSVYQLTIEAGTAFAPAHARGDFVLRDELLTMGLRLADGISRARFRERLGLDLEAALDRDRIASLTEAGFLDLDSERLVATPAGRQRLNAVLTRLLG